MLGGQAAVYGLKLQTRCLSAQLGQSEKHRFLVGTLSAREENEIHLIEFDEDESEIRMEATYSHPYEVWNISACPHNPDVFFTCYHNGMDYKSTLWKMRSSSSESASDANTHTNNNELKRPQSVAGTSSGHELTKLLDLPQHHGRIRSVLWDTHENSNRAISIDEESIRLWQFDEGCSALTSPAATSTGSISNVLGGCWDPHHAGQIVTVDNKSIRGWDIRLMKETHVINNAHQDIIRDVDYNPNKPYHIVTGGDDRKVCLWDLRRPNAPLKILFNHTHWVLQVKFNRFHDQLILTAGTELVNLWSITSVSSAPIHDIDDHLAVPSSSSSSSSSASSSTSSPSIGAPNAGAANPSSGTGSSPSKSKDKESSSQQQQQQPVADRLIKTYTDHEDSIYGLSWSAADAWIFASLSYDGRVVINHVPPAEKYKILL